MAEIEPAVYTREDGYTSPRSYADAWRAANPDEVWSSPAECPLCCKMIQTLGVDFNEDKSGYPYFDRHDPHEAMRAHVAEEHPEYEAIGHRAAPLTLIAQEIRAAIHANCNHREHRCPCECECTETVSCDCGTGSLCTVCYLHGTVRGEAGHTDLNERAPEPVQ